MKQYSSLKKFPPGRLCLEGARYHHPKKAPLVWNILVQVYPQLGNTNHVSLLSSLCSIAIILIGIHIVGKKKRNKEKKLEEGGICNALRDTPKVDLFKFKTNRQE